MKLLVLLMLFVVSGCSTPLVTKKGGLSDQQKNYPDMSTGYILGFIGATTNESTMGVALNTRLIISYDDDHSHESIIILSGHADEPLDYESESVVGRVFLVEVPVGKYSINSVSFQGMSGTNSIMIGSRYAIGYNFDVKEGEINYIGSFIAESYTTDSLLGRVSNGRGYFVHSFDEQRDRKLGLIKYPYINFDTVNIKSTEVLIHQPPLIFKKTGNDPLSNKVR